MACIGDQIQNLTGATDAVFVGYRVIGLDQVDALHGCCVTILNVDDAAGNAFPEDLLHSHGHGCRRLPRTHYENTVESG